MDAKRQITHEGEIILGTNTIPCYILGDGTRVLSGRGMQEALNMVDPKEDNKQSPGTRLQRYLTQKTLEPFIFKGKEQDHYKPIECYKGDTKINGYEGTVLADICDAFLEARNMINLSSRQKIIADQCEILIRGFARVGIIALIDEATGYQYDREKYELQKILTAYVLDEAAKWQIMFGLDFYKEIYRLWGLSFTSENIRKKPKFIAVLTNKYIYSQLPDGVYDKIKENNPKTEKGNYRHKHHQYLTTDIGREHQKRIIYEVTAIASISDYKEQFNKLYGKKYSTEPVQLELEFNEEPEEHSSFNKNLKKALEYKEATSN